MVSRFLLFVILLTAAAPAVAAQEASLVSGASHFTLFALGVLGLIIGRKAAMRDSDQD
ncbi:hypothetical protein KK137_00420 [Croceibacterium sp. LX-88]|uniref:Uncharacterized protein n=1 Tax=Croceibacterium selenioxidans TaxID=2838833 RepID=A0ABS5VZ31_9SPHN|nr:hypothetical protein [Croceibacterium selenioxidans]MBT2132783.1 hypothetical protein [Croceibacterium selenioxidans]